MTWENMFRKYYKTHLIEKHTGQACDMVMITASGEAYALKKMPIMKGWWETNCLHIEGRPAGGVPLHISLSEAEFEARLEHDIDIASEASVAALRVAGIRLVIEGYNDEEVEE